MNISKQIQKQAGQIDKQMTGLESKLKEFKKEKARLQKALKHLPPVL